MCGIAGFAGEDQGKIERMVNALAHRGPDGQIANAEHGASLGHARLAILDPRPEGNQPMWNESKTLAIVYNGEIFNFKSLREEEKLDCKTGTDTEVVLKLFEKHGTAFLPRLRGMFAFGIYDVNKREWTLVRDANGIKPLFVSYPENKLHFASEMRALISALPSKPAINMTALSQYLRLQYVPGPETMCKGIESLPPGTILKWSENGETRTEFKPQVDAPSYRSRNEFREEFPALMDSAIKEHLVSDKPVGIFLSGGMDSSIALHHMCAHSEKPVRTFTVRFDATEEEDAKRFNKDADLAKMTAKHYGTEHHEVFLSADICRDIYRDTARALDQPNADSTAMAQVLLAREAKKVVDVVLLGSGGDELFGGYPRYRIAHILNSFKYFPRHLRGLAGMLLGKPRDVLSMKPGVELAERLLARPTEEILNIQKGDWFEPDATTQLFADRYANLESTSPVRAFMEFDRNLWLVDESLRLADATTMSSGLEGRIPFLDPRVIASAHATREGWNVTMDRTKTLLKDTYRPILPDHIFTLNKACFFPPLAKWIRRECAPLVEEMMSHPRINELFDTKKLQTIFQKHKDHEEYNLHVLSSLTQLSAWFSEVYDA
jgi:asparagine synthase (glutamine-hydrolysing)